MSAFDRIIGYENQKLELKRYCKGSGVMVIATVNNADFLPNSLIRAGRFDKTITINFPSYKDAPKILKYYLSQKKCIGNIDIDEIAMITDGFSCAQMEKMRNIR